MQTIIIILASWSCLQFAQGFGVMKQLSPNSASFIIDPFSDDEPILHNGNILTESPLRFGSLNMLGARSALQLPTNTFNYNGQSPNQQRLFNTIDKKLFVQFPQFSFGGGGGGFGGGGGGGMAPGPPPPPDTLMGRSPDMISTFPAGLGPRGILQAAPLRADEAPGHILDSVADEALNRQLPASLRKKHNKKLPSVPTAQIEALADVSDAASDIATPEQVAAQQARNGQSKMGKTPAGWKYDDKLQSLLADGSAVPYSPQQIPTDDTVVSTGSSDDNGDKVTQYDEFELMPPPPSVVMDNGHPTGGYVDSGAHSGRKGYVRTHHKFAADDKNVNDDEEAQQQRRRTQNNNSPALALHPDDDIQRASLKNYFDAAVVPADDQSKENNNENDDTNNLPQQPPTEQQSQENVENVNDDGATSNDERTAMKRLHQEKPLHGRRRMPQRHHHQHHNYINMQLQERTNLPQRNTQQVNGDDGTSSHDNDDDNDSENSYYERDTPDTLLQAPTEDNIHPLPASDNNKPPTNKNNINNKIVEIVATQPSNPPPPQQQQQQQQPKQQKSDEIQVNYTFPKRNNVIVQQYRGPVAYKVGYKFDSF